jgi:hypothetical protein
VPELGPLRKKIAAVQASVRRNREDFSSFALSAEYLEHVYFRQRPGSKGYAAIADRDRALVQKLEAEWDASRPPDSPGKSQALPWLGPQDQLLFRMREASNFSGVLG